MLTSSQRLTNHQPIVPGIPRVKFKKKDACQVRDCSDLQKFIEKSEKFTRFQKKQLEFIGSDEYKENLQPIIIEKKKMEILSKRNHLYSKNIFQPQIEPQHRFSLDSCSRPALPSTQGRLSSQQKIYQMDKYCLKMSESIILSSDTIESQCQQAAPISNDSFVRIKSLGQGKFGKVYLVMHKETGFICAMKIISKKVIKQEKVDEQIIKQIRIHSSLQSGNVVEFYGFFHDEDDVYLLLEYASEGCLLSKFKGRNRLEEDQIVPIIKGICDGLRHIHGMGYVHRDMKPQNVVLQFGIPKICDFGWASQCNDSENLCKSYCGTPLYLSPEMIKREFYGTSVDIWSVGLITYELLVGRVPFSIWSENDLKIVLSAQIKFPEYIDRSQECEQFILGALEKDALKRESINKILSHRFLSSGMKRSIQLQIREKIKQILNDY